MLNFSNIKTLAFLIAASVSLSGQAAEPAAEHLSLSEVADEEVSIGALHGAFKNAGDSAPLVLIVPGSGPIDRDGNIPGMASDVYRHLARQLASEGISTVRVDKHGMYSSHNAGDPNKVTYDLYTKDYGRWAAHLTAKTGKDCIYLLGHSEGGLMVSGAAVGRNDICGLILAAAPGQAMGALLREQIKANPANKPIKKKAFDAISALEAGHKVDVTKMHPALQGLFAPAVQDYLISIFPVNPVDVLREAKTPAIIIQGDNDLQVSIKDAKLLAELPDTELILIKNVNHVLKKASRSPMRNFATYNMPDRPVDPAVIDAIASFVKSP